MLLFHSRRGGPTKLLLVHRVGHPVEQIEEPEGHRERYPRDLIYQRNAVDMTASCSNKQK